MAKQRLQRSETNRVIAGVAGGLGEYFDVDPTLIRLIFIMLTVFGGGGVIIYIILWIMMPEAGEFSNSKDHFKYNLEAIRNNLHNLTKGNRSWLGWAILIFGIFFLLRNFGLYDLMLNRLWPLLLILIGISMLFK